MPCAHLDTRLVDIIKVDHQEEIAGIGIARAIVILVDLYAIGIGTNAHLLYIVIGKADVDELVALKAALNIADILLLAKAGVLNHLIVEVLAVLGTLLGLLNDMTHDDDSIVVEDALDIVGTLKSEGSLVVLEEGGDDHTDRVGPSGSLAVEDIIACGLVETEGDRLNLLIGIEGKGSYETIF